MWGLLVRAVVVASNLLVYVTMVVRNLLVHVVWMVQDLLVHEILVIRKLFRYRKNPRGLLGQYRPIVLRVERNALFGGMRGC